jgi:hypothetical protein
MATVRQMFMISQRYTGFSSHPGMFLRFGANGFSLISPRFAPAPQHEHRIEQKPKNPEGQNGSGSHERAQDSRERGQNQELGVIHSILHSPLHQRMSSPTRFSAVPERKRRATVIFTHTACYEIYRGALGEVIAGK